MADGLRGPECMFYTIFAFYTIFSFYTIFTLSEPILRYVHYSHYFTLFYVILHYFTLFTLFYMFSHYFTLFYIISHILHYFTRFRVIYTILHYFRIVLHCFRIILHYFTYLHYVCPILHHFISFHASRVACDMARPRERACWARRCGGECRMEESGACQRGSATLSPFSFIRGHASGSA